MLKVVENQALDFEENQSDSKIYKDFKEFIIGEDHPCIMAKTVFSMDKVNLNIYKDLGNIEFTRNLYSDLKTYINNYDFESNDFETFIAIFPESVDLNEMEFEEQLWLQLYLVNNMDEYDWDPMVSSNPQDENFSFSIAGKSFYVVGLHSNSSRKARRAPYTAIAFNLHWQFEKLREMGTYQRVRDAIRDRDKQLQGTINPMLEDFGTHSEARQYSGRKVEKDWECPFK
ncbi:guanitoxin biosynthesis heme-dependent pre-guanitoxin N-hydroxylase GntA [Zunongwangia sp. HRR-M8]|uniref:guanitoxin biosynthesis heme-dependent pre-guanitoxin N-hydroxylase GntA n=1 Tax=Zunongwangia sp. HRR-M8 TaxID=3015170 RepID=UPI0022DDB067|nr:guanitoxin biosynthesis heme-dependent pre-guanitoxin N-hydroxylase GntA [Zunongwangia sp. HRR-M8]WBL22749.1 guanitoxin biosynthesis heme-dependent pre-guanitoxin N-hydroxylase GntA [Zunongwangia sp. HRR-M8]